MENLEQQVKAYYLEKSLSEQKVSRILAQAEQLRPSIFARPVFNLAVVAAAVILVGTVLLWVLVLQQPGITDLVLTEIVANHRHGVRIEFEANQYDILQAKLDKLTFSIIPTQPYLLEQFDLLGGRYCHIQGNMAVQLKLKERRSGMICTLYVTPLTSDFQSVGLGTMDHNGTMIKLWEDNDRLFGLAGEGLPQDQALRDIPYTIACLN